MVVLGEKAFSAQSRLIKFLGEYLVVPWSR